MKESVLIFRRRHGFGFAPLFPSLPSKCGDGTPFDLASSIIPAVHEPPSIPLFHSSSSLLSSFSVVDVVVKKDAILCASENTSTRRRLTDNARCAKEKRDNTKNEKREMRPTHPAQVEGARIRYTYDAWGRLSVRSLPHWVFLHSQSSFLRRLHSKQKLPSSSSLALLPPRHQL